MAAKALKVYYLIDTLEKELKGMRIMDIDDPHLRGCLSNLLTKTTVTRKCFDKMVSFSDEDLGTLSDIIDDVINEKIKGL